MYSTEDTNLFAFLFAQHAGGTSFLSQFFAVEEQLELTWTNEGVESNEFVSDPLMTRSSVVLIGPDINRGLLMHQS